MGSLSTIPTISVRRKKSLHTFTGTRRFSTRDLPTGTITLLFTDIEGSTHLLQRLGERYAELLNECRTLLRTTFHTYHGQEVDAQGDAMFAVFARASDALEASVAAQRELALHSWPGAEAVRVRMCVLNTNSQCHRWHCLILPTSPNLLHSRALHAWRFFFSVRRRRGPS